VTRCQVRELSPNVVSIDFQRRNLLAHPVRCPDLTTLAGIEGAAVDLGRVWAGRTEYGHDWHLPLTGGHTLTAGATGAGKNSVMWCPLVSIAPAIRDGWVRVSGIDPKGMELAYGRGIFHRYAVTGTDAPTVLDELVAAMETRKTTFAGRVRVVPVTRFSYTPWYERNTADQAATTERCWWERRAVAAGVDGAARGDLLPDVACEG
jgi:S-DNA-T family DNA segregation ATPase FtsK/SpoIIIE